MVPKKWIKRLLNEVDQWLNEGLIEPTHAQRIKERYSKQLEYNRLVSSIFVLGSILVGLGILLFIASNWYQLGRTFRVGLIFSFIIVFNYLGYSFRYQKDNAKLGESLIFLGAISFGAGIWLIAQMFQFQYGYDVGILCWIIGILPVVYLLRSQTILVLSSLLTPIWLYVMITHNPLKIVYTYFLLFAAICYLTYHNKNRMSLFISLVGMMIWLGHFLFTSIGKMYNFSLGHSIVNAHVFIAYGFLLYALGMYYAQNKKFHLFAGIYKLLGLFIIFLNNYGLTFLHHVVEQHVFSDLDNMGMFLLFNRKVVISMSLLIIAALFIVRKYAQQVSDERKKEVNLIYILIAVQFVGMFIGIQNMNIGSIWFNLLFFAQTVAFLYVGYLLSAEYLFRLSLFAFSVNVITRYFDWFWQILHRSIFFIMGGVLLIAGGIFMEKKRKEIEKEMRERAVKEQG